MKKLLLWCLILAMLIPAAAFAEGGGFAFAEDEGLIKGYEGAGGQLAVPAEIGGAPVFGIDRQAFMRNVEITALTIPEPVALIEDGAISTMEALESVQLPDTLLFIGSSNFMDCGAITEITIPAGVLAIEQDCFVWDDALASVTFTGPAPAIGSGCFRSLADGFVCYVPDDQLEAYAAVLPEGLRIEGSGSDAIISEIETPAEDFDFDAETGAITAYLGDALRVAVPAEIDGVPVTRIGSMAFYYNERLFQVVLPESVTAIESEAFRGAKRLVAIQVPDGLSEIGDDAFAYSFAGEQFPWPAGLKTIGDDAFAATQLKGALNLPEGLETIGEGAFANIYANALSLPASLKQIGARAFRGASFRDITFGSAEVELGEAAFENVRPNAVTLPWNTDAETLQAYTDLFTALNADCEITLGERPEGADDGVAVDAEAVDPETAARYAGVWYLNSVVQAGTSMSAADLGLNFVLTLNEDGTAELITDEAETGVWTLTDGGIILSTEGTEDLTLTEVDGTLTAGDEDLAMVFAREQAESAFNGGEAVSAESADAFNGAWEAVSVGIEGMVMPLTDEIMGELQPMLGMQDKLILIQDGVVTLFGKDAEPYAFEDGRLKKAGEDLPGLDEGALDEIIELRSDGTIAYSVLGMTLTCERAEAPVPAVATEPEPTEVPTPEPTEEPTPEPTEVPTPEPTEVPTPEPTEVPTPEPTEVPTPEPTEVPTPEPTQAPVEAPAVIAVAPVAEARYACTEAVVSGYAVDPTHLGGDYAVVFHANGTADLTLAGAKLTGLAWREVANAIVVDYYGAGQLRFVPVQDGYELDYQGAARLHFTAE